MEENVNTCTCGERPEVELNTDARPLVVLSDEECDCDCECSDVELYTPKQPDVLLFEEYCEEYADDIVAAKDAALAAKVAVDTNAEIIIAKENLLLDDTQTIKRELREKTFEIHGDIVVESESIKGVVQSAVTSITTYIDSAVVTIIGAINAAKAGIEAVIRELSFPTFEACTDEEVYEMFERPNTNNNQQS